MNKKNIFFTLLLLISLTIHAAHVDTLSIKSASMNIDIQTVVISPDGAFGAKAEKYPVVYLLHGYMGDAKSWIFIKPNLTDIADEKGIIFVCPDAKNSWYYDSPVNKSSLYETFVSTELVKFIDKNYQTKANRKYRAITGLSMGGHGALYIAFRHKKTFGACGSMSGALDMSFAGEQFEIGNLLGSYATSKENWIDYATISQIKNISNGNLAIIIDCGLSDFLLDQNKRMHMALLNKNIDHDFILLPGEHTVEYWNNSIDYHILFFSKFFSKKRHNP